MLKAIVTFLFLFFSSSILISQTIYYVSPNGDDENSGLTLNQAVFHIQKAINLASPGDTIKIQPGNYYEPLTLNKSNLTIQAADSTNKPIIIGNTSAFNNKDAVIKWTSNEKNPYNIILLVISKFKMPLIIVQNKGYG